MTSGLDQLQLARRNRQAVLQLIRSNGGMSRRDLSLSLGFSAAALTKIARDLLEPGLILEQRDASTTAGRPPTRLTLNPHSGCVISISLSHTLDIGLVDLSGKLLWQRQLGAQTDENPYTEGFEQKLPEAVESLLPSLPAPCLGVGVLTTGRVDRDGVIRYNTALPGGKSDIRALLARLTDLPVLVDQEFRLLLRLHRWDNPGETALNIVAFSGRWWGFGSSQAAMVDGRLCYGRRGFAGQAGSKMPVIHDVHAVQTMRATVRGMGGESVYLQGVRNGDGPAMDVFSRVVDNYGYRLSQIVNYFDPEMILIYGPYFELGDLFLEPVRDVMARHVMPGDLDGLELRLAGERTPEVTLRAAAVPVLAAALGQQSALEGDRSGAAELVAARLLAH